MTQPLAVARRPVSRPIARWVALAAGAAVVTAAVTGWVVLHGALDLDIYLWGGRTVTHGAAIYQSRAFGNWFTYPPFAALTFLPLAHLPLGVAEAVWYAVSLLALVFSVAVCLDLTGRRPSPRGVAVAVGLAVVLEPVWHTFALGQVNLLLLALVLWDVRRLARGRWCGVGIGVAAAVKLTPALFAVTLLAAGRRRAAAVAAGTFGLCTGIGALVAPTASQEYWSHLVFDTGRVGVTYISNQSPFGVVARLFGGPVGGWYAAVPVVVGITGVAVAACFARIGDYLAMTAATGLTMLLVCPISWSHHWVWALPALPVCGRGARRRDRVVVAGCYAVFLTGLPWWTPHDGGAAEFGWHGVTTLAADSYAVVGLVLLGSLSWLLVRPPRGSAELSSLKERGPVRQLAPHVARNA